ncbi:hypothetical protein [Paraburkholderia terrae]
MNNNLIRRICLVMGLGLFVADALADAVCPDPIPNDPAVLHADQLIMCVKELKTAVAALQTARKEIAETSVPKGAIVSFDLPNGCPEGWQVFDPAVSRMIVGAVAGGTSNSLGTDASGNTLTARPYRAEGGAETFTLTVGQLPPHSHSFNYATRSLGASGYGAVAGIGPSGPDSATTDKAGGGQPVPYMPPFIALFVCKK